MRLKKISSGEGRRREEGTQRGKHQATNKEIFLIYKGEQTSSTLGSIRSTKINIFRHHLLATIRNRSSSTLPMLPPPCPIPHTTHYQPIRIIPPFLRQTSSPALSPTSSLPFLPSPSYPRGPKSNQATPPPRLAQSHRSHRNS